MQSFAWQGLRVGEHALYRVIRVGSPGEMSFQASGRALRKTISARQSIQFGHALQLIARLA